MDNHSSAIRTLAVVFLVFVPSYLTLTPNVGHCPSKFDGPLPEKTCLWDIGCPDGYKCCVFNNRPVCVPSIPVEKKCPLINEDGICVDLCSSDSDCSNGQLCCSNGCGHECKTKCPLINEDGICVELCSSDSDCSNGQLCCSNGCGHVCKTPIIVKPGQCPDPRFTHQCGTRCFQDGQCSGEMKCCPTSCGQACRHPI